MIKKIFIYLLITILFNINCTFAFYNDPNYLQNNAENTVSLYKNNVDSMVYIETQDSSGSGVIVNSDGTFITCFHVIANADYITVKLNDGSIYNVNGFRYINPLDDIAILTLDTKRQFKPIALNPSNNIEIGEKVYTISNPQGMQFTFSDGMVSQFTKDYIQFTAPISPGSSGGALLNKNGELLGMITSLLQESQNINFALPNGYYKSKINNQIIKNTKKLNWTDFVIENASEEQFKLFTEYALNNNPYMYYKYMRNILIKDFDNIPNEYYTALGHLALINAIYERNPYSTYYEDAAKFYYQAIEDDVNVEPALIYASAVAISSKNEADYELWRDELQFSEFYDSYDYIQNYKKQYDLCKSNECYYNLNIALIDYMGSVTNTEGKHSKIKEKYFIALYKKTVAAISQATTLNVALIDKSASDYGTIKDLYNNLFDARLKIESFGINNNWQHNSKNVNCGTNYAFTLVDGVAVCINKFTPYSKTYMYIDVNGNKPPNELTIDANAPKDIYEIIMYDQTVLPYREVDKTLLYKTNSTNSDNK